MVRSININKNDAVDVKGILNDGFDLKKHANDYIDVLAFLLKYDLEMVCDLIELYDSGNTYVSRVIDKIKKDIKCDVLDLEHLSVILQHLGEVLDGAALD